MKQNLLIIASHSIQFNRNECSKLMSQDDDDQDNNLLVVPGIINAPRTPGDMSQVSNQNHNIFN